MGHVAIVFSIVCLMVVLALPTELDEVLPAASRAPQSLGVLALVIGRMICGIIPNVQAARLGCLLMGLLALVGGASPWLVLGTLFALTAMLGLFISNTATAVLMAPVALAIARDLGASPYPFAMIVALAVSSAFITPISSPVNTLVVGPGNYAFGDFVRIGVPLPSSF